MPTATTGLQVLGLVAARRPAVMITSVTQCEPREAHFTGVEEALAGTLNRLRVRPFRNRGLIPMGSAVTARARGFALGGVRVYHELTTG